MEEEDNLQSIEVLRQHLYDLVSRSLRLTDPRVVAVSQKLDKLLTQVQNMKRRKPAIRCTYKLKMKNWVLCRSSKGSFGIAARKNHCSGRLCETIEFAPRS